MNSELTKGKPLTKEETKALLELIEASLIITTKTTNATNNKMKNDEWVRIAAQFNATAASCRRIPAQLRLKWENLKKNARKRSTKIRMNNLKTGSGPSDYIPPDDILDRVTSLLGSTVSGLVVPFGGDREEPENSIDENFSFCSAGDGSGSGGSNSVDATVNLEFLEIVETPVPGPVLAAGPSGGMSTINTNSVEDLKTPAKPKRLTFKTPKSGKQKFQDGAGAKIARDLAIAEYYTLKKMFGG